MTIIRKAVFPVAGLGTRFLPATKANPKEMLPIVDKPLIQYAAEEAVAAGITELIFVTSSAKRAIEDHFDSNQELESLLIQRDDQTRLRIVQDILPQGVSCVYVRQNRPLGLGHAVLCTKALIGNEPFAVLLADDLILSDKQPCLAQMVELYQALQSSILAVELIPASDTDKYGIVAVDNMNAHHQPIHNIIEKPKPDCAPSNLAAVGRYILTPEIFDHLAVTQPDKKGEIQLTDGIASLLKQQAVHAYRFEGRRFDCGNKIGYLKATVQLGLQHAEVGREFAEYLRLMG